jgi:hypothetical protein
LNKLNLIFTTLVIACIAIACTRNVDEELALSREASKQLGSQLKRKLVSAMQSSRPEAAISVCNLEAINISTKVSNKNNLKVGRTSLKIRNTENKADAWETKQLKWFETQKVSGVDIKTLETSEIIKENGEHVFRYMKVIPMQEQCTLCHGTTIAPSTVGKINSLYPQDQATEFEVGDIRGAFTVKIVL